MPAIDPTSGKFHDVSATFKGKPNTMPLDGALPRDGHSGNPEPRGGM